MPTATHLPLHKGGWNAPVRNPQKLVATVSRSEGVYNRTGEPSVIFAEKEELHSEWETAKGCCERYEANDDVVGRRLAAAEEICIYITVNGYYQIKKYIEP